MCTSTSPSPHLTPFTRLYLQYIVPNNQRQPCLKPWGLPVGLLHLQDGGEGEDITVYSTQNTSYGGRQIGGGGWLLPLLTHQRLTKVFLILPWCLCTLYSIVRKYAQYICDPSVQNVFILIAVFSKVFKSYFVCAKQNGWHRTGLFLEATFLCNNFRNVLVHNFVKSWAHF